MKKIFTLLIFVMMLMSCTLVFANYPANLNGDPNFILVDGHMGSGFYVDRSSLNVQKYAPPQYIIAVNVITARSAIGDERDFYHGGQGKIISVRTLRFFYNWDLRKMYVDRNNGTNDWRYLNPSGSWAETGVSMPAGEMAYALAYNMKFYGTLRNIIGNKTFPVFSDDFYSRI